MIALNMIILFILIIERTVCESESSETLNINHNYMGEKFLRKYLEPEDYTPTKDDLDTYLTSLGKVVTFFGSEPNKTDVNRAITLLFVHGVLRRSILDDSHKVQPYQKYLASEIIKMTEYILSHFRYADMIYMQMSGKKDKQYNILQLLTDSEILARSLPNFSRNKLKQFILRKGQLNEFVEDMDDASLPKEKYATVVDVSFTEYYMTVDASDTCLSRVSSNLAPQPGNEVLQACKPDPYCKENIHASPSIAYGLSHRMLNLFIYRTLRHCYWVTPQDDELHMDILCSFMYREAVYIARRGFFARDLFLEHVGLCGMRGYLEFYRAHWFKKAIQWIDDDGCIHENRNFHRNYSGASIQHTDNEKAKKRIHKRLRSSLRKQCHDHPMAVLVMFLANAVRHAFHYME